MKKGAQIYAKIKYKLLADEITLYLFIIETNNLAEPLIDTHIYKVIWRVQPCGYPDTLSGKNLIREDFYKDAMVVDNRYILFQEVYILVAQ